MLDSRVGTIVQYTLNGPDADAINARPLGAFSGHNTAYLGDVYPAMIVRDWGGPMVNLQVFYDGDGSIWATSRSQGDGPGTWR